MKKFIALTLGLSFIGATLMIIPSDASRNAYHQYFTQKIKDDAKFRTFTDRRRLAPQRNDVRRNSFDRAESSLRTRNYRNSLLPQSKRNLYSAQSPNPNLRLRTSSNRIFGSRTTPHSSRTTISPSRLLDTTDYDFQTYATELFSLEIPTTSVLDETENVVNITIPGTTIEIKAEKLATKCVNNLSLCARAISRTMDNTQSLTRTSQTVNQYRENDTILGSVGLDSKKFVEGFVAVNQGTEYFISRYISSGLDGDVFVVETKSELKDLNENLVFAKKLFSTFRAKY